MKQVYSILCLLLVMVQCAAQHYSCISPEYKTFFTNEGGYLRGMRIDSVKISDSSKIFFPFKTARIENDMDLQMTDTGGGSWLGAELIEDTAAGVTYIPTINGDTVVIKNSAALNESWTFYRDTASRYYEATVTDMDTATFAGITDSVKIIRINAKNGSNIITADPLNDLELVLSKSHGFFQAIGLYLFPYLKNDYYFTLATGQPNGFQKETLIFKRVPFHYPTNQVIYDFEPGDIFYSSFSGPPEVHSYDRNTILSKDSTDTSFSYQVKFYSHSSSGPYSSSDSGITTWNYHNGFLIDSAKMPEEWYNRYIYHYWYQNFSFCITSNMYQTDPSHISSQGQLINFEAPTKTLIYKEKLGKIKEAYLDPSGGPSLPSVDAIYQAKKKNSFCDEENHPASIKDIPNLLSEHLKVYPNPVRKILTVSLTAYASSGFSIELYDLTGQKIMQRSTGTQTLSLNVAQLSAGMYFLKITAGNQSVTQKVSVLP